MSKRERSRRSCRLSLVEPLESRSMLTLTVAAPLPDLNLAPGAAVAPVDLGAHFKDANASPDFAVFDTTLGTIPVLLTPKSTPITVANFLNYVNKGSYTNTIVHRSVPGFIWQAGGFQLSATNSAATIAADAAIKNEFGASNVRGTIAMAKLGSDPNSATSQFFFNESDRNASNLDLQNSGFTVFGRVVGTDGLAVMDAVAGVSVPSPSPLSSPLDQIPLLNYTAGQAVQPANLVLIKGVTTASEVYATASSAPGIATASVRGNTLTVNPLASGTAEVVVVGYGSDGVAATEVFTVNVAAGMVPVATPPAATAPPAATTTPPPTTPAPVLDDTNSATSQPPVPTTTTAAASVLVPVARGPIPAAVVAGGKGRIQQTVALTSPVGPVAQRATVTLSLSRSSTGSAADVEVASVTKLVKVKPGKPAKLTLAAKRLNANVPAGSYHLLVSVTDPTGAKTTVDTGKTLVVAAARSRLAAR